MDKGFRIIVDRRMSYVDSINFRYVYMYIKTPKGIRRVRFNTDGPYVMIGGCQESVDDLDIETDIDKSTKWLVYGNGKPEWVYTTKDLLLYVKKYIKEKNTEKFMIGNINNANDVLLYRNVTDGEAHDMRNTTVFNKLKYVPVLTYARQKHRASS